MSGKGSLSARRAWIEIADVASSYWKATVALRKESVDRNNIHIAPACIAKVSLSARRAWIEILLAFDGLPPFLRRSPQGERG